MKRKFNNSKFTKNKKLKKNKISLQLGKITENQNIINIINDYANLDIKVGEKCKSYNKYKKNIWNVKCDCCSKILKKRNKKIYSFIPQLVTRKYKKKINKLILNIDCIDYNLNEYIYTYNFLKDKSQDRILENDEFIKNSKNLIAKNIIEYKRIKRIAKKKIEYYPIITCYKCKYLPDFLKYDYRLNAICARLNDDIRERYRDEVNILKNNIIDINFDKYIDNNKKIINIKKNGRNDLTNYFISCRNCFIITRSSRNDDFL